MSIIYIITAALSLILLALCCLTVRRKDKWFLVLYASVFVVNTGYMALSLSKTLEAALMANRLAYLGSVFLPTSMLIIIMNVCSLVYKKRTPAILLAISAAVFLVAASPGILNIYYKEVSLATISGITVLNKVYGPLHPLYLIYLLASFAAMIAVIIHAYLRGKLVSAAHAFSLAAAVFINIGVWLLEQLVRIDFELLSVSYIISEVFLLSLYMVQQEKIHASPEASHSPIPDASNAPAETLPDQEEKCLHFASQIKKLTPTECIVFNAYLAGKSTDEILKELNIKMNTIKYHNRNIYNKLGVSSRKQMLEIAATLDIKEAPIR